MGEAEKLQNSLSSPLRQQELLAENILFRIVSPVIDARIDRSIFEEDALSEQEITDFKKALYQICGAYIKARQGISEKKYVWDWGLSHEENLLRRSDEMHLLQTNQQIAAEQFLFGLFKSDTCARLTEALSYASRDELLSLVRKQKIEVLLSLLKRYDFPKPKPITREEFCAWGKAPSAPMIEGLRLPPGIRIHRVMSTHLQEEAYDVIDGKRVRRHCIADKFRAYTLYAKAYSERLRSPKYMCLSVRTDGKKVLWTIWVNVERRIVEQIRDGSNQIPGAKSKPNMIAIFNELIRSKVISPVRINEMHGYAPRYTNRIRTLAGEIAYTGKAVEGIVLGGKIIINDSSIDSYIENAVATHGVSIVLQTKDKPIVRKLFQYVIKYRRKDIANTLCDTALQQDPLTHIEIGVILASENSISMYSGIRKDNWKYAWAYNDKTHTEPNKGKSFALHAAHIIRRTYKAGAALNIISAYLSANTMNHPDVAETIEILIDTVVETKQPAACIADVVKTVTSMTENHIKKLGAHNCMRLYRFLIQRKNLIPPADKRLLRGYFSQPWIKTIYSENMQSMIARF